MKLESTQRTFYDQDKDFSCRETRATGRQNYQTAAQAARKSDNIDLPPFMTQKRSQSSRVRVSSQGDVFETAIDKKAQAERQKEARARAKRRKEAEIRRRKTARENLARGIATLMTVATIAGGAKVGGDYITRFNPANANYDAMGHTITEVAEWSGVDEKAILLANQMTDANEQVDDIVLPESYSPLEEDISKLQERLEKDKLTNEERLELQEELDFLVSKQQEQNAISASFIDEDGKFVYIVPDERTSAETIKDAYGIKDGVLKDYNDMDYVWGYDADAPEHKGFKDYTGAHTSGVRVPADEIGNFDEE